jgi:hypothetical protein
MNQALHKRHLVAGSAKHRIERRLGALSAALTKAGSHSLALVAYLALESRNILGAVLAEECAGPRAAGAGARKKQVNNGLTKYADYFLERGTG